MAIMSLAVQSQSNAQGTAACEVYPSSTTDRVLLLSVTFTVDNATSPQDVFGLGIPAAAGVGRTANSTNWLQNPLLQEDYSALNSSTYISTSWSTQPTVPTKFFRRTTVANTTGSSWTWTFPNGIIISPQSSVVLWNIANNDIVNIEIVCDE